MRINEILTADHKSISIITPNRIERKLLIDRLCIQGCVLIDKDSLKYNDTFIKIMTVDEILFNWSSVKNSLCFIEFPESMPEKILQKLQMNFNTFILTNELI